MPLLRLLIFFVRTQVPIGAELVLLWGVVLTALATNTGATMAGGIAA